MNVTTKAPLLLRNIERARGPHQLRGLVLKHATAIRDPELRKIAQAAVISELTDLYAAILADIAEIEATERNRTEAERKSRDAAIQKRRDAWKAGSLLSLKTASAFEAFVRDAGLGELEPITGTQKRGFRPAVGCIVLVVPTETWETIETNYSLPPTCCWESSGMRCSLFWDHSNTSNQLASVRGRICSAVLNSGGMQPCYAPIDGYRWITPPAKTELDEQGLPTACPARLLAAIEATQHNPATLDKLLLTA